MKRFQTAVEFLLLSFSKVETAIILSDATWVSLKIRRRRSLISAQGFELARTLGYPINILCNPERVPWLAEPFQGYNAFDVLVPGFELARTLG